MINKQVIIIPARIGSTRLPSKVMADINGKPMIQHIYERCVKADCGDVFVACDSQIVVDLIEKIGGKAVMTDPDLKSGTDRVYAALTTIDPDRSQYYTVINVQGDVPNIESEVIVQTVDLMTKLHKLNIICNITTPIALITDESKKTKSSVVKPIVAFKSKDYGKALYFTRATAPFGDGNLYEHIGLYVYTRKALEKFVTLSQSDLEKRESLEQLRALENDMTIYAQVVQNAPVSVDIQSDLEEARSKMI